MHFSFLHPLISGCFFTYLFIYLFIFEQWFSYALFYFYFSLTSFDLFIFNVFLHGLQFTLHMLLPLF